jgi:hypothetical protein
MGSVYGNIDPGKNDAGFKSGLFSSGQKKVTGVMYKILLTYIPFLPSPLLPSLSPWVHIHPAIFYSLPLI